MFSDQKTIFFFKNWRAIKIMPFVIIACKKGKRTDWLISGAANYWEAALPNIFCDLPLNLQLRGTCGVFIHILCLEESHAARATLCITSVCFLFLFY